MKPGDVREVQLALDLPHVRALGAEDFLPAPCNQEALGWLARWPDWGAPGLALVGPEGSGKSHLARIFAHRTGALEIGPGHWPEAVPPHLVLDPALPIVDEVRLLAWYRMVEERGGHLLLTAETPPAQWPIRLPDLASRLRALPIATLAPPDDALLGALLVKLFRDRGIDVGAEVVPYLVSRMERSFRAAKVLVAELDAHSLEQQRPVTVPLARAVLDRTTTE